MRDGWVPWRRAISRGMKNSSVSLLTDKPFLPQSRSELISGRAADFRQTLLLRAAAGQAWQGALERAGTERLSNVLKGSIGPLASSDSDALAAFTNAAVSWQEGLRSIGVFDRLLPDMVSVPLGQKFGVSTQTVVAPEANEAAGIVVQSLSIDGSEALTPRRVSTIIVLTRELLRVSEAQALVDRELRNGATAGVDSAFLTDLVAATTPTVSAGSTTINVLTDVSALLAAVPLRSTSRPAFVFDPAAAVKLSLLQTNAVFAFPNMTPLGGKLLGIDALVSDQLPSGTALLLDASSIAAGATEIQIDASNSADIQLDTAPNVAGIGGSPSTPVPAAMTSLFQTNSTALKVSRYFSFRVLRADLIASLSGVSY